MSKLSRPSDSEVIAVTGSAIVIDTASTPRSYYLFVRVASFDVASRRKATETTFPEEKPSSPNDSSDHISITLTARRVGWLDFL